MSSSDKKERASAGSLIERLRQRLPDILNGTYTTVLVISASFGMIAMILFAKWQLRLYTGESAMHQDFAGLNYASYFFLVPVFGLCACISRRVFASRPYISWIFLLMFIASVIRLAVFIFAHV